MKSSKMARITRNSDQMLKKHYLGMLVPKETAKAYFEIMPKDYAVTSEGGVL